MTEPNNTTPQANTVVDQVAEVTQAAEKLGRDLAAQWIEFGRVALQTTSKTLNRTADALGEMRDAFKRDAA